MNSWYNIAPPKKQKEQWKCTRSAMELSRYITDNLPEIPTAIKAALKYAGESSNEEYEWLPEYETSLPGNGGGRNHDLIMFGKGIVVGIEAKADEPFDSNNLSSWLNEGKKNSDGGKNRKHRLDELCKLLFNEEYSEEYKNVMYQLVTALSGTIIEAKNRKKNKALFIVLSFDINEACKKTKVEKNNSDFKFFINKIGKNGKIKDEKESINCPEIEFAGHKKYGTVDTYIVKASVKRNDLRCKDCGYRNYCDENKF